MFVSSTQRAVLSFGGRCIVAQLAFALCTSVMILWNGPVFVVCYWYTPDFQLTPVDRAWRTVYAWLDAYDFSEKERILDPACGYETVYDPIPEQLRNTHNACIEAAVLLPGMVVALVVYHALTRRYVRTRCASCGHTLLNLRDAVCPSCEQPL
jgi:hypothetical protein